MTRKIESFPIEGALHSLTLETGYPTNCLCHFVILGADCDSRIQTACTSALGKKRSRKWQLVLHTLQLRFSAHSCRTYFYCRYAAVTSSPLRKLTQDALRAIFFFCNSARNFVILYEMSQEFMAWISAILTVKSSGCTYLHFRKKDFRI